MERTNFLKLVEAPGLPSLCDSTEALNRKGTFWEAAAGAKPCFSRAQPSFHESEATRHVLALQKAALGSPGQAGCSTGDLPQGRPQRQPNPYTPVNSFQPPKLPDRWVSCVHALSMMPPAACFGQLFADFSQQFRTLIGVNCERPTRSGQGSGSAVCQLPPQLLL